MSLRREIDRIHADGSLAEEERVWAALRLIADRFDRKVRDDEDDDILGAIFGGD